MNHKVPYHPLRRDPEPATVAYVVATAETIPPYCLSIPEAARYVGVSERTLSGWLAEGRIPKVRVVEGGRVLIRRIDIEAFVDAHRS